MTERRPLRVVRLKGAAANGPALELAEAIVATDRASRRRALGEIARQVFLDRNAQGIPKTRRSEVKPAVRVHLRQAIAAARKSRDALRAGNVDRYEEWRDRARMHLAHAREALRRPYLNDAGKRIKGIAAQSPKGVRERAAARMPLERLDELIDGCRLRGDQMRPTEWAREFGVSRSTVDRKIAKRKNI